MAGSSPATGPGQRPALPRAGAILEGPGGAAGRPVPPSAHPCYCCCLHLDQGKGFWVHKEPGDDKPPAAGHLLPAIAEEVNGGKEKRAEKTGRSRHFTCNLGSFKFFV